MAKQSPQERVSSALEEPALATTATMTRDDTAADTSAGAGSTTTDGEILKDIRLSVLSSCRVILDNSESEQANASGMAVATNSKQEKKDDGDLKLSSTTGAAAEAAAKSQDVKAGSANDIRTKTARRECYEKAASNLSADPGKAACLMDASDPSTSASSSDGQVAVGVPKDAALSPPPLYVAQRNSTSRPGAFACEGINHHHYHTSGEQQQQQQQDDSTTSGYQYGDGEEGSLSPRHLPDPQFGSSTDITQMSGFLSVANLVTEEEDEEHKDLQRAQAVDAEEAQQQQKSRKRHQAESQKSKVVLCTAGVGGLLLLALIVFLAVYFATALHDEAGTGNDAALGSLQPSPPPETQPPHVLQTSPQERILSLLPTEAVDRVLANHSIQHDAFQWLVHDPNISNYSDARVLQRFALATLYLSTGGVHDVSLSNGNGTATASTSSWIQDENWLSYDHHECDWWSHNSSGIFEVPEDRINLMYNETGSPCNSSDGTYEHLWFWANGLRGTIPEEVFLLSSLKSISMDRNEIHGTIPSQLGQLRDLEALALFNTELTGSIPSEVGLLTQLSLLWLMSSHNLGGTIPTQIGQLSRLQYLLMDNTNLTGSIPSEIGGLTDLIWIFLFDCQLTGSFPTEMGRMEALDTLWVWRNQISGPIPSEFGMMNKALEHIAIDINPLQGSLPTELGWLSMLTLVHVGDSQLTGTIPSELGLLGNLTSVTINSCELTGTVPTELGQLTNTWRFWSWNTHFSGTLPTELGLMESMETLAFDENDLEGSIPSEIGLLSNLSHLYFTANKLTSSIPTEFGQLSGLSGKLWLQSNQLSGALPSQLGLLQNVSELLLHDNRLTGSVPVELGDLEKLSVLSLFNNSGIGGNIPSRLCNLTSWDTTAVQEANQGGIQVDCNLVECPCDDICICAD